MYLIVGLGNIGCEYENTRHNVGFNFIDLMADKYNIDVNRIKFKGVCGEGLIKGEKVILLKPSTYMNLSGESVIQAVNFYKIPNEHIIVVHDDISLEVGRMRIRSKGSAGGHNGLKNIILHLNSDVFTRIKIGVGAPNGDLIKHVLGKFSDADKNMIYKICEASAGAVEAIITQGINEAMNKFNGYKIEELKEC